MNRFARSLLAALLVASLATAGGFDLQMKLYLHTPEVLADRPLGFLSTDPRIPLPAHPDQMFYVRYLGNLALYGPERLVDVLVQRKIPGLDLGGERDVLDFTLRPLARATHLRLLKLDGTRVSDRGLFPLMGLKNLEVLTLSPPITDEGLESLRGLNRLVELGLAGTQVTDRGLLVLKNFPALSRLDLDHTVVTDDGLRALDGLPLEQLRLGEKITAAGLAIVSSTGTLRELDLSDTALLDPGASVLRRFSRLHTLFLPRMTADGALAGLGSMRGLKRLDMTGTHVSDDSASALAALRTVEELSLARTTVSDATVRALASLPHLRFLDISESRVTADGLRRFPKIPSLEVLSISWSGTLHESDLRALAKLPRLHTLIINGRVLDRARLDKLRTKRAGASPGRWWAALWPVATANAAEPDAADPVVDLPSNEMSAAALQLAGLRRIHYVESELDNIIPSVAKPEMDVPQETEKNFLGEFTIDAGSAKKKPAAK